MRIGKVTHTEVTLGMHDDTYGGATAFLEEVQASAKATIPAPKVSPFGGLESLILGFAKAKSQAKAGTKGKPGRKSVLEDARKAVAAGQCPPMLEFKSLSNYTYNRHAMTLWKMAQAGDIAGVTGMEIKGTNTYSKALRGYRDLLVTYLAGEVE